MSKALTDAELRVLGTLIEKSLTHPGSYPLTANTITLGCSQKQNRDPVVDYAETDVLQTLKRLESKGLVKHADPSPGARVYRFAHCVLDQLRWDRYQQAIMAELMLRGRQTAGELRTHASRMVSFEHLSFVGEVLQSLMTNDPPLVEELPREPGRSANRFRHLLSAEGAAATPAADTTTDSQSPAESHDTFTALSERMAELETKVVQLSEIVERLQEHKGRSTDTQDLEPQ